MPNQTIYGLPANTTPSLSQAFPTTTGSGSADVKTTIAQLVALIDGSALPYHYTVGMNMSITAPLEITVTNGACKDATNTFDIILTSDTVINGGVTGVNGVDVGVVQPGQQYYIYAIGGTAGSAMILSLNATAPAYPTGYSYRLNRGFVTTDVGGVFLVLLDLINFLPLTNPTFTGTLTGEHIDGVELLNGIRFTAPSNIVPDNPTGFIDGFTIGNNSPQVGGFTNLTAIQFNNGVAQLALDYTQTTTTGTITAAQIYQGMIHFVLSGDGDWFLPLGADMNLIHQNCDIDRGQRALYIFNQNPYKLKIAANTGFNVSLMSVSGFFTIPPYTAAVYNYKKVSSSIWSLYGESRFCFSGYPMTDIRKISGDYVTTSTIDSVDMLNGVVSFMPTVSSQIFTLPSYFNFNAAVTARYGSALQDISFRVTLTNRGSFTITIAETGDFTIVNGPFVMVGNSTYHFDVIKNSSGTYILI